MTKACSFKAVSIQHFNRCNIFSFQVKKNKVRSYILFVLFITPTNCSLLMCQEKHQQLKPLKCHRCRWHSIRINNWNVSETHLFVNLLLELIRNLVCSCLSERNRVVPGSLPLPLESEITLRQYFKTRQLIKAFAYS